MGNIKSMKKWISYAIAGILLITNVNPVYASNLKQEEIIQEPEQLMEECIQEETEQSIESMSDVVEQSTESTEVFQNQMETEQSGEIKTEFAETDVEYSENISTELIDNLGTETSTEDNANLLEENAEEFLAGNSLSDATSIPLNGYINGRFDANSYGEGNKTDVYKITVSGNSSICLNIRIVQYFSSLNIKVYNSNGDKLIDNRLDWNSNLQQGTNDTECFLDPGIYYIELGLPYLPLSGNYVMQLSYTTIGNLDTTFDDTIAAAHPISLTTNFTGVMAHGEYSDIYRLDVTRPGIVSCKFNAYINYVYIKLLDVNGNVLWEDNPHWNDNIKYSTNDYNFCLENGAYYLQIHKFSDMVGKYTLQNKYFDIGSNEHESNDTIATANNIVFEQTYSGLMAHGETSDIYKFVLVQNAEVRINFTAYMPCVYLRLYDASGNEIQSNEARWNENVGYSNNIYAQKLSSGTYYLQISSYWRYRGKYQFSVKIPSSIANASISCASSKVYTGKEIRPDVTVTYGGQCLSQNIDYTVEYSDNYWIGKATVKVTGMGNYVGEKVKTLKFCLKK